VISLMQPMVATTGGLARLGLLGGLHRVRQADRSGGRAGMMPGVAVAVGVGVDLMVPRGDAVGVVSTTSMVGDAACCTMTSVVMVSVEPRFVVGRRQPQWL
jgi:hypothetical protein